MKIMIQGKAGAVKYIAPEDIEISGIPLKALFDRAAQVEQALAQLTKQLQKCHIIKKDSAYIIDIKDTLHEVDRLHIYEAVKTDKPLHFYKVENGELVLDKKKVGAII